MTTEESSERWVIPDQGVLCEGRCIRVVWPEDTDLDAITALRNRPEISRQFLDSRPLDPVRNRQWLLHGMKRPYEAVLAIRMKFDNAFVGSIGWSNGDAVAGTLELGRVMIDAGKASAYSPRLPRDYPGIAVDAGVALRDFLFATLPLRTLRMTVIAGNRLSLRAATAGGGRIVASGVARRADGVEVDVAYLECKREDCSPLQRSRVRRVRSAVGVTVDAPSTPSPIPLFRTSVPPAARARLLATLDSGWLGYGPQCRQLEERFTAGRGGWSLATSSCTSALYLAGRLVRELAGEAQPEIIVPSITFVASAMAFLQAGVRPVVADVGAEDLLLGVEGARRALTAHTRALLAVHLYGQRCPELPALRALADEHGLLLIEDCAHRVDLLDNTAPLGDLLCYSFNAVKELPGGEAGLLWGRERRHEAWVRPVSNLGLSVDTMQRTAALRHADYAFAADAGLKLRSNDVAAALVNAAIESLPASRAQRREQFRRYDRLLSGLAAEVRPLDRHHDDSCLMYVIRVAPDKRDAVRAAMGAARVATSVHYPALARHPLFGNESLDACCGNQDTCVITLPTFAELTADDQHRVVEQLSLALDNARRALRAPAPAVDAEPRAMTLR